MVRVVESVLGNYGLLWVVQMAAAAVFTYMGPDTTLHGADTDLATRAWYTVNAA